MTDLVVSAVKDYGWDNLKVYANSLSRSGFSGQKLIFVDNISRDARRNLLNLNFELIDFVSPTSGMQYIVQGRFEPVISFLNREYSNYRYIVWTDARDVIFQSDPAAWLQKNLSPSKIIGAGEGWRIGDESLNNGWAKASVSTLNYNWLRQEEACCGGTVAGCAEQVLLALSEIYRMTTSSGQVNDQAALNFVLRTLPLKEVSRVPRNKEGWTATLAAYWTEGFQSIVPFDRKLLIDESPRCDRNTGIVYAPETDIPFAIVHQYNRDPYWKMLIDRKYQ